MPENSGMRLRHRQEGIGQPTRRPDSPSPSRTSAERTEIYTRYWRSAAPSDEGIARALVTGAVGAVTGAAAATGTSFFVRGTLPYRSELLGGSLALGMATALLSSRRPSHLYDISRGSMQDATQGAPAEEQNLRHEGEGDTVEQKLKIEYSMRMHILAHNLKIKEGLDLIIPDQDSPQWEDFREYLTTTGYQNIVAKLSRFRRSERYMLLDIIGGGTNPDPPFPKEKRLGGIYMHFMQEVLMEYQKFLEKNQQDDREGISPHNRSVSS